MLRVFFCGWEGVPQGLGEGDEVDWFGFFGGIIELIGSLLLHGLFFGLLFRGLLDPEEMMKETFGLGLWKGEAGRCYLSLGGVG